MSDARPFIGLLQQWAAQRCVRDAGMNDSFTISLASDSALGATGHAKPGTVTMCLTGEIDMAALPELRQVLEQAWLRRPQRLVVDLAGVSYLTVSAVGPLLTARSAGERDGVRVSLRDPQRLVRRLLTWAGLEDALEPAGQPASDDTIFTRVSRLVREGRPATSSRATWRHSEVPLDDPHHFSNGVGIGTTRSSSGHPPAN
jgi:anti-anti-sigma factor